MIKRMAAEYEQGTNLETKHKKKNTLSLLNIIANFVLT